MSPTADVTADSIALERNGFVLLAGVISQHRASELAEFLTSTLQKSVDGSPLESRGTIYAARNPLDLLPEVTELWRGNSLGNFLQRTLGHEFGLVRGLFFDKPPGRSWSLPWHKDLTMAVRDNQLPSRLFTRPTLKAEVPHVIAPPAILVTMLTIRLHLDDVTAENGPLRVLPGSHQTLHDESLGNIEPMTIFAQRGDALAMRPMLSHASGESAPKTKLHRRILHLEFASSRGLPDGYQWHRFISGCE